VATEAKPLDLTVLIPVFNEEENIQPLLDELVPVLDGLNKAYEILVVDDGSTDRTYRLLTEFQKSRPQIRLIKFARNYGKMDALAAGFKRARGDMVVTMDGDLQNDPRDIPRLLERIGPYDLVIGHRVRRNDNWFRRLQSRAANRIRNAVIRDGVADSGCGLQAFRREPLQGMRFFRGLHRFLPALFKMEGYKVAEIPVNHRPRHAGRAKYGIRNRVIRAFDDMMAVRWIRSHRIDYEIEEER
jgi:glycosyltransferase involved in cell wall biosynthesis